MAIESAPQAAITRHRWTVDEYYRMAELGILEPDARVELLDGEVVDMPPIGPEHAASVDDLGDLLVGRINERAIVRRQNPIRLGTSSEPEPDIVVVQRRADRYRSGHPTARDVLLVIEVSDSTLATDREVKGPLYAQAGIAEYWIVNLVDGQVEVHRDPTPNGYQTTRVLRRGDTIQPLAFPEVTIVVADILG